MRTRLMTSCGVAALLMAVPVADAQPAAPLSADADSLNHGAAPSLRVVRIKPSRADPAVKAFDDPSVVVVAEGTPRGRPLAVFLPGTNGRPDNVVPLLETIAGQGYRVIGLEYDDEPSVVQVCPGDPKPDCSGEFRRERIFGGVDGAPVGNPVEESIVRRLVMLLRHLDRTDPDAHWADYLDGDEPAWSRIVVSGLSQGAGMAAYIAKQRRVARVVLFSSPWDFQGRDKTPAPWLADPSVTPVDCWYAELHRRENTAALIARAYQALKIPDDHLLVFDLAPPSLAGPNPFHGSTVRLSGYAPQWRWLYGSASREASASVGGSASGSASEPASRP